AAHAERRATAVVVRDHVVLAVAGIAAGADPRDRRHLRPRRTRVLRAAAAGAEEAVDRAMTPVVAILGIPEIAGELRIVRHGNPRRLLGHRTRHRQERQGRAADQGGAEPREEAPPRRPPRETAGTSLDDA